MAERPPPGSDGEHRLQERYGTGPRAAAFYKNQLRSRLNEQMRLFLQRQEMMFVASADARGECDISFRAGLPGFVCVIDEQQVAFPELRGNGVMATLGNLIENPHIGLLLIDFFQSRVGLHINGRARILSHEEMRALPNLPDAVRSVIDAPGGLQPERWVLVTVQEAYIHCAKHIPLLRKVEQPVAWGTDDPEAKGGDYFQVGPAPGSSGETE